MNGPIRALLRPDIIMLSRPRSLRFSNMKNKADETVETLDAMSRFFLVKTGKHLLTAGSQKEVSAISLVE